MSGGLQLFIQIFTALSTSCSTIQHLEDSISQHTVIKRYVMLDDFAGSVNVDDCRVMEGTYSVMAQKITANQNIFACDNGKTMFVSRTMEPEVESGITETE